MCIYTKLYIFQWSGKHAGIVTSCNFSHDERLIVSGSDLDNTVKIWDANTGELIHNIDGGLSIKCYIT